MRNKGSNVGRKFLINAVLLTIATIMVGVMMPSWGVAQIVIIALLALISGFQWVLWFNIRKM